MSEPVFLLPYLAVKLLAYSIWCHLGLRWFAPERPHALRSAISFGTGRLLLGIGVGLLIFLAALSMNNATRNAPLTYVAIYVPARILEWLLWYRLLRSVPGGRRAWLWILGGVLVSCLADLPIAVAEHGVVPVGRPFC